MFKFRKPKSDPYGIAPWPRRERRVRIDTDPVTVALARKVVENRTVTDTPEPAVSETPPKFSLSGPFYETA